MKKGRFGNFTIWLWMGSLFLIYVLLLLVARDKWLFAYLFFAATLVFYWFADPWFYPQPKQSYELFVPNKILVKFDNTATILMTNGRDKVEFHLTTNNKLTPKKELWLRDSKINGSEVVVTETGKYIRKVYLESGEFAVTREVDGYFVSWEAGQQWRPLN